MKCEECIKEGKKSKVYDHGSMQTCMGWRPFYDEEGIFHNHDPNEIKTGFKCSNGHQWTESKLKRCPSCDYGKDE